MKKVLFLIIAMGLVGCASNQKKMEEDISGLKTTVTEQQNQLRELNVTIEGLIQNIERLVEKFEEDEDCGCSDNLTEEEIQREIDKEDRINSEEISPIRTRESEVEDTFIAPRPDNEMGVTTEEVKEKTWTPNVMPYDSEESKKELDKKE